MAAAGIACSAIWIPQFLGGGEGSASSSSVASGPTEEEMAAMTALVTEGGPSAVGSGKAAAPVDLAPKAGQDSRDGLGSLLQSLGNFGAGREPRSLDELATDWARVQRSPSGSATEASFPGDGSGSGDELSGYLIENPFRGTLIFADDAVALVGPYALRVGDELLGGEAVVAKIESKRLTIIHRGIPREFALPPLRVQSRSQMSGGAENTPAAGAPTEADAPPLAPQSDN